MLYGANNMNVAVSESQMRNIVESFLYDDISRGDEAQIREFCASDEAKVLTERSVLKKGTLMRLSKSDDEKRRIKLVAYNLAKEAKDPLWTKLQKNRRQEKMLIGQIMKKYGHKAKKIAVIAQKEYIKTASKMPASKPSHP